MSYFSNGLVEPMQQLLLNIMVKIPRRNGLDGFTSSCEAQSEAHARGAVDEDMVTIRLYIRKPWEFSTYRQPQG